MKRLLLALALILPLATISPAVAADDDVAFTGSGWGHGVGMSQYGAYGMALDGASPAAILGHYYQGSEVVDQADSTAASFLDNPRPLWVGIQQDVTSVQFRLEGGGADLCQAGDGEGACPKAVAPQDGESWVFRRLSDGTCIFDRVVPSSPKVVGSAGDCVASVTPDPGATLVIPSEGRSYDHGILRLREPAGHDHFHVSLQIAVQDYLMGIAEMPTSWAQSALRAQAIAARSYAFAQASGYGPESSFSTANKERCWCHVYDDTRSQVFKGDVLSGSASWRSAVDATNRKVVAYHGTLITAFYSSSSGGRTENVEDVWGGDPRPWLVSVDDSFAKDPRVENPLASWTRVRSVATVASAVGLDELHGVSVDKRPSGGVESVTFSGKRNGSAANVTRSGAWVRSAFGLPSHYFSMDVPRTGALSAYDITSGTELPIGWIDGSSGGVGTATIQGWAMDPDTPLPIAVHVYTNGSFADGMLANGYRRDVEKAYGNGANHGFRAELELPAGSHRLCIYGINAPSRSGNPLIGCRTVVVDGSSTTTTPPPTDGSKPFGWLDGATGASGSVEVRGWAIDRDDPDAAVGVHVYVDGAFAGGGRAGIARPDVNRAYGLGADHGFHFSVPASSGSHRVCVYLIDVPTKSGNPQLACRTVAVP